jgi:hypothetical protein
MNTVERSKIYPVTMLRCAILLQGEDSEPQWWKSSAAKSGAKDLQYVFPRTAMTASFMRANELAKELHDRRTKQHGAFNLFRLPFTLESEIHKELVNLDRQGNLDRNPIETFYSEILNNSYESLESKEGPIDCGNISVFKNLDLKKIALCYDQAFRGGYMCIPYFSIIND